MNFKWVLGTFFLIFRIDLQGNSADCIGTLIQKVLFKLYSEMAKK